MATIGLRDLFMDKATIDETTGVVTYAGNPKRMAKAITAELSVEVAEAVLYGDDGVDEKASEFVSGTLSLNVTDLTDEITAEMLGKKKDTDGVIFSNTADDPPYLAIGFRAKKPRGRFKYVWLYLVKFKVPSESYQTKGDGIEFKTPELEGTIIADAGGNWKADKVMTPDETLAKDWFKKVRVPGPIVAPPAEPTPEEGE